MRRHTACVASKTLIGTLRRFRHVDSQLPAEGIDAHHSCVDRCVAESWELVVVTGDIVQGLCNVSCSLQDNFLVIMWHSI